jgi:hypothetical protein
LAVTDGTPAESEAVVEEDVFKEAMIEYENEAPQKYKTGVDPSKKHTITELGKTIDDAVDKYQAKDKKGVWGKIRNAFSKLGEGQEAMEGWLGLLPDQSEYFSVICGGLKLIIGVRHKVSKTVAVFC